MEMKDEVIRIQKTTAHLREARLELQEEFARLDREDPIDPECPHCGAEPGYHFITCRFRNRSEEETVDSLYQQRYDYEFDRAFDAAKYGESV